MSSDSENRDRKQDKENTVPEFRRPEDAQEGFHINDARS